MSMKRFVMLGLLAAALPAAAQDAPDPRGYLYGTVETDSNKTYRGLLRWGNEEAFWDDLFNSAKRELPALKKYGDKETERERIEVFGVTIGYRYSENNTERVFIARFGDIAEIEPRGGDDVRVTMKDGSKLDLEGASNDVGAAVTVLDEALGDVKLDWEDIEHIRFEATPKGIKPPAPRLFGKVETDAGSFEGFIQWDSQECLGNDKLDGETDDGDVSIEMGKIRSIAKHGSDRSKVELEDGRSFVLGGTNDVDSSLRGIFVDDPRYGRVKIEWRQFDRLELRKTSKSGRGYDEYKPARKLQGRVTDRDGKTYSGKLVFDLDEEAEWEMLNGNRENVEYYIPFAMVRSIEPRDDDSLVGLRGGEELVLEDAQDVSDHNAGVLVQEDGGRATYVRWRDVERVSFE